MNSDITPLIEIAHQAGRLVLDIYNESSYTTVLKIDQSPLTQADIASHSYIQKALSDLYPSIPIISEEAEECHDYAIRKDWDCFFLVDPLDGTKEFINRNGEFTINIALIKNKEPILGVVHAPALSITYYAVKNKGAYKIINNETISLSASLPQIPLRIVASRSHRCAQTEEFIKSFDKETTLLSAGSALKFGLIAEGKADLYPRFSPTMEWDTAAGHLLVTEIGKQVKLSNASGSLTYNKPDLRNPGFIVQ